MDVRLLKTFQMVATLQSFSQAAFSLDYAQSTVTAHIQALEEDMGVPLFNRLGRQIELTDAGKRMLDYAERLLDLVEETRQVVSGEHDLSGTLTIAAPETVASYRLPQVLRRYRKEMPNIHLIFRPMPYAQLYSHARDGKLDIVFMLEQNIQNDRLCIEKLSSEPVVLIAAPDHPLAFQQQIDIIDLRGESLLLTERGCGYRSIFEHLLLKAGIMPGSNMEFDSIEAIKQCVKANIGIAVLPYVAVARELAAEELVSLQWNVEDFMVYTQMLWHKDKELSPAMRAFIQISHEILGH